MIDADAFSTPGPPVNITPILSKAGGVRAFHSQAVEVPGSLAQPYCSENQIAVKNYITVKNYGK